MLEQCVFEAWEQKRKGVMWDGMNSVESHPVKISRPIKKRDCHCAYKVERAKLKSSDAESCEKVTVSSREGHAV